MSEMPYGTRVHTKNEIAYPNGERIPSDCAGTVVDALTSTAGRYVRFDDYPNTMYWVELDNLTVDESEVSGE